MRFYSSKALDSQSFATLTKHKFRQVNKNLRGTKWKCIFAFFAMALKYRDRNGYRVIRVNRAKEEGEGKKGNIRRTKRQEIAHHDYHFYDLSSSRG